MDNYSIDLGAGRLVWYLVSAPRPADNHQTWIRTEKGPDGHLNVLIHLDPLHQALVITTIFITIRLQMIIIANGNVRGVDHAVDRESEIREIEVEVAVDQESEVNKDVGLRPLEAPMFISIIIHPTVHTRRAVEPATRHRNCGTHHCLDRIL